MTRTRPRPVLTPLLVLLAAAMLAYAISCIPTAGIASADPAPVELTSPPPAPATVDPTAPRPSDRLHDPLTDPAGAIDDAVAARRQGWPLLALVVLILVSRGLGKARTRWPSSRSLAWMGGRAGLVVIGAGIVAGAAFDALALGGSWFAAGAAAIGAALALLDPAPARRPSDQRRAAELGTVELLPGLALAVLAVIGGLLAWSCAGASRRARDTAGIVVACTADTLRDRAAELVPRVLQSLTACTRDDGTIDAAAFGGEMAKLVADLGPEVTGCAAERVVADLIKRRQGLTAGPAGVAGLRDAWARVRTERFGGRTFDLGSE